MAEAQVRFDIAAYDKSKAAFDAFSRNARAAGREADAMGRRANSAVSGFSNTMRGASGQVVSLGRDIRGLAAAFGVFAGINTIKRAVEELGNLADQAKQAGIDVERLQALMVSAQDAGVGGAQFVDAMQKFNLELGEARNKGNDLKTILDANGISLTDANGKIREQGDMFNRVADLIARARNEQEAALIAETAFGRGARDMLPWLREGADAIAMSEQAARNAGDVIDAEIVAAADEFADAWERGIDRVQKHLAAFIVQGVQGLGLLYQDMQAVIAAEMEGGAKAAYLRKNGVTGYNMPPGPIGAGGMKFSDQSVNTGGKSDMLGPAAIVPELGGGGGKKTTGGGGSSRNDTAREAVRQADAIKRVIDNLKFEQDQLGRTETEQHVYNALKDAGVSINSKAGQEIAALVRNLEAEKTAQEAVNKAIEDNAKKAAEQQKALEELGRFMGEEFQNAFEMALQGDSIKDILSSLLTDLSRMFTQFAFTGQGPLAGILGSGSGGMGGGGLGGIFGSLFSGLFGGGFSGFYADGGNIPSGRWGIAGESGPEIIAGPAAVIPARSGSSSTSGNHHVSLTVKVDGARGSAEIEEAVRSGVVRGLRITRKMLPGWSNEIREQGA